MGVVDVRARSKGKSSLGANRITAKNRRGGETRGVVLLSAPPAVRGDVRTLGVAAKAVSSARGGSNVGDNGASAAKLVGMSLSGVEDFTAG